MSAKLLRSTYALLALLSTAAPASAQWGGFGWNCACEQPVTPIAQTCYQSVATTQWQPVKQKVKRPVVRTEWQEREVTVMQPYTETHIREVPAVRYQTVTECRTIQRSAGYWRTCFQPVPKASPCQYDSRPGLIGFLNRTSFSLRNALTPSVIAQRQFVAQPIVQTVPVTRRVAVPTTQKVTVHETKYRPVVRKEKVAVQKVDWTEQEVVTYKPVTVVQTVPVTGSTLAYGYSPYYAVPSVPQTVLAPSADPISQSAGNTDGNSGDKKRTAESTDKFGRKPGQGSGSSGGSAEAASDIPARRSSFENGSETPIDIRTAGWRVQLRTERQDSAVGTEPIEQIAAATRPAAGREHHVGWRPTRRAAVGPELVEPAIQLATAQP